MIMASYLIKHLLTHRQVGLERFAACLTAWNPASDAMNWQWVAGCWPDASPCLRIFNPAGQAARFDADGRYRRYRREPSAEGAQAFAAAAPAAWRINIAARPIPATSLAEGGAPALAAYGQAGMR